MKQDSKSMSPAIVAWLALLRAGIALPLLDKI